mmetsp:Transcript_100690/g.280501  ORF Transcript_100690/g.280501 Transcript_100690/m.280501 type:complete len:217 (-) Transcript_100690:200-850(-)
MAHDATCAHGAGHYRNNSNAALLGPTATLQRNIGKRWSMTCASSSTTCSTCRPVATSQALVVIVLTCCPRSVTAMPPHAATTSPPGDTATLCATKPSFSRSCRRSPVSTSHTTASAGVTPTTRRPSGNRASAVMALLAQSSERGWGSESPLPQTMMHLFSDRTSVAPPWEMSTPPDTVYLVISRLGRPVAVSHTTTDLCPPVTKLPPHTDKTRYIT